jgi:cytochrome o ubiquinol oxidase subunit 1
VQFTPSILWTIGFFSAFVVGGVTGVLLAVPPADYMLHNSLFLAAHFLFGIIFLVVQLVVSIREREATRDLTGDPWNGRTLEWATASPPAVYNFPRIPQVQARDAFWDMKLRGVAHAPPVVYEDIHMPKDTPAGFVLGVFAFLFGFAMVWHIWWLASASTAVMLTTVIVCSFNDDIEYVIPAAEVERAENARRRIEGATVAQPAEPGADAISQPIPQV